MCAYGRGASGADGAVEEIIQGDGKGIKVCRECEHHCRTSGEREQHDERTIVMHN